MFESRKRLFLPRLPNGCLAQRPEHEIADLAVTGSNPVVPSFLVGVVGNISACHADARGSIPRRGAFLIFPVSLVGQDIALSPRRPGFKSRTGNPFC